MKVEGTCHCGAVRYEAEVDPADASLCNCTDCQMLTGSAYRVSVRALAETFKLFSGQLTPYVKIADSGARRRHSFCSVCGTPVHATADTDAPPTYSLRIGCLKQKADLPPRLRIWCDSALTWSQDVGAIPGIPRQ
jgi:hypothetical protein